MPPTAPAVPAVPPILVLSDAQLDAYNARDTDAFCACFADDVRVLDEAGAVTLEGMAAFRARYAALFEGHVEVGARLLSRLTMGPHVVEHEVYHRRQTPDAALVTGEVIVRYTERQGRIALVEFLRP